MQGEPPLCISLIGCTGGRRLVQRDAQRADAGKQEPSAFMAWSGAPGAQDGRPFRRLPRSHAGDPRKEIVEGEAEPAFHAPREGVDFSWPAKAMFPQRQFAAEHL